MLEEKPTGVITKMASLLGEPVKYSLVLNEIKHPINSFLGKKIHITFTGNLYCTQCNRSVKRLFQQGFCYPCFSKIQECNNCIIFPERCLVEKEGCSQSDWAHTQCHADQIVYLSYTSGLKVGVTRSENVPSRWIDQGALQAKAIFRVSNRYRAGLLEVAFKNYVSDRTHWQKMLKGTERCQDFLEQTQSLTALFQEQHGDILEALSAELLSDPVTHIDYPVIEYPNKIATLSLEKTSMVEGILLGIKGQYLFLSSGVLNVRKFSGYEVSVRLG